MAKYHGYKAVRKARKKNRKFVLCSRDMRIMRLLFESKIMSREQIGNQFFPDVSKDTVNRRLRRVTSVGLIKRKPIELKQRVFYGYSLTQKGLAVVKPTLPYEVKTLRSSSECPLHDIALNDIRQAFEAKSAVQSYYTENVMQGCDDYGSDKKFRPFVELNSDAMAEVDTRIGVLNLAIEFDATHKSKSRYLHKVNHYYVERGVDGVLYVCANKHILNILHKIDKEVSDRYKCEHKLYFALLADVTGAMDELTFTNAKKGIFGVR